MGIALEGVPLIVALLSWLESERESVNGGVRRQVGGARMCGDFASPSSFSASMIVCHSCCNVSIYSRYLVSSSTNS